MQPKEIMDIRTARRCMEFKLLKCDNKDCLNKMCPLNKFWDEKQHWEKK
jgi:hypothetical protein